MQARIEVAIVVHGNALQQTGDSCGVDDQLRVAVRIREAVRVAIGVEVGHQVLDACRRKLRVVVVARQGVIRLARVVLNGSELVVSRFERDDVVQVDAVIGKRCPSVFRIEGQRDLVTVAGKAPDAAPFERRLGRELRLHDQHRAPAALIVLDSLMVSSERSLTESVST